MKICIQGPQREGKTHLIELLKKAKIFAKLQVSRVEIWDGNTQVPEELYFDGSGPEVEILVTNNENEASQFFLE